MGRGRQALRHGAARRTGLAARRDQRLQPGQRVQPDTRRELPGRPVRLSRTRTSGVFPADGERRQGTAAPCCPFLRTTCGLPRPQVVRRISVRPATCAYPTERR
ncbi:hypothetical protein SCOCK_150023 [Actinacidiphila cocklensis]|uniref:Uncharacterized protein n=1 Tax=Actinacidiphila cocklensis TaxID=887465 RepID=A0A9W4GQY4_9ACTN|nr:hypothetical protein SCOCK_150023 [Actinacidiphila cocklensis]